MNILSRDELDPNGVSAGDNFDAKRRLSNALVIDDDPTIGVLIGRSLQSEAETNQLYSVPVKGTLDLEDIDIVYLDYQMPFRDGLDILAEIRATDSDIPVVFLTGFGERSLAERAIEAGADVFLTKPVGPSVIIDSFRRFARRHTEGRRVSIGVPSEEVKIPFTADRRFEAISEDGEKVAGTVSRFGYRSAHVDFDNAVGIPGNSKLSDIRFRFGDQVITTGEAIVGMKVRSSSTTFQIELLISGSWGASLIALSEPGSELNQIANAPLSHVGSNEFALAGQSVDSDFRLAVYDIAEILDSVRSASGQRRQNGQVSEGSVEALKEDERFVIETARQFGPGFWEAVQRLEGAADRIVTPQAKVSAKEFARRVLFPFTLSSPFLSRVVERPIGVPGDFGMLGQILGNPLEGFSTYDRIVNSWILSCGAASAYRYRVDLLYREICNTVKLTEASKRPAKIMSMASGVAYEIQRFIESSPVGVEVDFQMVDFSTVTLAEAERQYSAYGDFPEGISVSMHQSSVIDLANRSRGFEANASEDGFTPDNDYDLIYCAGLFDYLSDRMVKKVTAYLFTLLRPGGTLVVSNFTVENPIRNWMTYVMDWELIYRTVDDFEAIARAATTGSGEVCIETDSDRVEVYAVIKS
ncbi:MAG: response regulator [Verrucomicrobiales bacterium]|nr:response regulator [Verrucomicrobiales bacterium]